MFESRDPRKTPAQTGGPGSTRSGQLQAVTADVHLLDRLSAIYRHRRLVITVFLLVVTLMMLQSYSTVPLYRATARVLIEDERSTMVRGLDANDPVFWADPEPYYETQYRVLESRALSQRTLRGIDMTDVPEFSGQVPTSYSPLAIIRSARAAIVSGLRSGFSGIAGLFSPDEAAPDRPTTAEEVEAPGTSAGERALIDAFRSRIQVAPVVNTRLVDVNFTAADPGFAARALNAHLEAYVQQNLDRRLENTHTTLSWLEEELSKQQAAVEASERGLAEYRESQDAQSLGTDNIVSARLNQLNDAVTSAERTRLQRESLYNQVREVDPNSDAAATFPAVAQNAGVQQAKQRLDTLQDDLARLSARYGDRHPDIIKTRSSLEGAREQLRLATARAIQTIRNEYQSALDEERQLRAELSQQKVAAADLGRKSVSYSVLEREAESNRRVYESLLQQRNELQVVANSRANNVQVMDRAAVPGAPFTPNTRRDWFIAVIAGLMLSLGLVVVVEYLDDTIQTPDDVARRLRIPLLGLVPAVRGQRAPVLSGSVPHDFGESFRSLRTSLVFTTGSSGTRIIAVTSTQPLEGKTTTACNMAMVLALGGARVLVIDADMRRPSLHKTLGMPNAVGLSHVLVGQARIREAIQRTHDPNLFALTAGQPPPNPSELLASDRMKSFLTHLENGPFDWVVIDTPPVLAVTDAAIVAPQVSGVVFVIGAEMTRSGHAERAIEMLVAGGNPHVIGAVLNRVDFDRNRYYYSRYYGYHYKSYYGERTEAA